MALQVPPLLRPAPRQFTMPNPESFGLGIIAGLFLFAAIRAAIKACTDD